MPHTLSLLAKGIFKIKIDKVKIAGFVFDTLTYNIIFINK